MNRQLTRSHTSAHEWIEIAPRAVDGRRSGRAGSRNDYAGVSGYEGVRSRA
jgi:hypothetical protein